jgi:hypothetical protein
MRRPARLDPCLDVDKTPANAIEANPQPERKFARFFQPPDMLRRVWHEYTQFFLRDDAKVVERRHVDLLRKRMGLLEVAEPVFRPKLSPQAQPRDRIASRRSAILI